MAYSLLAHLYPRIKGSQEDVATFSLAYILEQSPELNKVFTKCICDIMEIDSYESLNYTCQDGDSEHGRPDIAGYKDGALKILCEAKFYAGLTDNQPASYLKRLMAEKGDGLVFICPENRIISLWDKVRSIAEKNDYKGLAVNEHCVRYDSIYMLIITWQEILATLQVYAEEHAPNQVADIRQLKGFCDRMESEAFIPFREEDFGAQVARDMERYFKAFDATYKALAANKDIDTSSKGVRQSAFVDGYAKGIIINGIYVSINFNRALWKKASSIETPYWIFIQEIGENDRPVTTDKVNRFMDTIDGKKRGWYYQNDHIALEPKPNLSLEEFAEDMAGQIIEFVQAFEQFQ